MSNNVKHIFCQQIPSPNPQIYEFLLPQMGPSSSLSPELVECLFEASEHLIALRILSPEADLPSVTALLAPRFISTVTQV